LAEYVTWRELHWRIGDQDVVCRIEQSGDRGTFHLSGRDVPFRIVDASHIEVSGKRHRFHVAAARGSCSVWIDGRSYELQPAAKAEAGSGGHPAPGGEIRALMPGKLLRLNVAAGDRVEEKQTLAVMESMKMESPLVAPRAGRVSEVRFKPGDAIDMGEVVIVIES
jgi:biotin carboxyl carrier protein